MVFKFPQILYYVDCIVTDRCVIIRWNETDVTKDNLEDILPNYIFFTEVGVDVLTNMSTNERLTNITQQHRKSMATLIRTVMHRLEVVEM